MSKTRRLWTNFSKGELSPLVEGRPDLAAYFEGGKTIENCIVLRQGGSRRRAGLRYIAEVKSSAKDTILFPFEFSVDDAFIIESGDLYFRFYKNKAQLKTSAGGPAVEVVSPYTEAQLRNIHFTQSADLLFLFHNSVAQRKLSRVSDISWALSQITYSPPPSYEADTDLVATLGIGANSGTAIKMRVGSAVFLAGDIGRQIIAGAGRAVITAVDNTSQVTVDILDAFSATITAGPNTLSSGSAGSTRMTSTAHALAVGNFVVLTSGADAKQVRRVTNIVDANTFDIDAVWPGNQVAVTWNKVIAIASGSWFARLSPQTTLDPTIKEPVGAQVTLVAGLAAFRAADVGKFIFIYGGLIKITAFDSTTQVKGTILSVLADATTADPAAAPAGSWTLEVESWSSTRGYPRTGEFHQGRLYQASTTSQPTAFWGSVSDNFDGYAIGAAADDAIDYTLASRQVNRIEWLADNLALFLGTGGSEHRAIGPNDAPLGGDVVPLVERLTTYGCAPIQPIIATRRVLFLERMRQRLYSIAFDLEQDGFDAIEVTDSAEHICGATIAEPDKGFRLGPMAFQRRPDPRLYIVREDGQLVTLTYHVRQKIIGFSRLVTEGTFEAVAVIPTPAGGPDQVWVIVKRTINGATKRYIEMIEEDHESLSTRKWTSLQTDCAKVYSGVAATTITGLSHLEGATVDVVADGSYKGQKVVAGGQITLDDAATQVEVGLHYESTTETLEPAVEGVVLDGIPRSWDKLVVRFKDTIGGKINGENAEYPPSALDTLSLFSGKVTVTGQGWDDEGRVTILQDEPYPMTVLSVAGTLSIGDQ